MYQTNYLPPQRSSLEKFLVPLCVLVHIGVFAATVTTKNFPTQSFGHVLVGLLFSCIAASVTVLYSKSNVPKFIAAFIVATFTAKLPLCLMIPGETFLNVLALEGKQLAAVVCERFFLFSVGFLGYSVGAIFVSRFLWNMSDPEKREARFALPEKGFLLLIVLYLSLQVMRIILLLFLDIGAPGVVTKELFIPRLAGILTILGSRGLLLVTAGLMAWALARHSYAALAVAMLAASTYAVVEMAGGWRSGMYYYVLCGTWVFLAAEPSKLKNRLKPFVVGFVVVAFLLFFPVMDYRNRIRQGMSSGDAVKAVLEMRQDDDRGLPEKFYQITKRFNGLDLYVVASHGIDGKPLGLMSLIDGTASFFFTFGLLGVPVEAVTVSGMTYWGSISIGLGDQWLWLGGMALGAFIGGLPMVCRHWFYTPTMRTVYECSVSITLLHLVMGNGSFVLYSKELFLSFLVCLLFKALATTKRAPGYFMHNQVQYPS